MGEKTKIEWCDFTFNPWTGCTKVSPGCDHCYAEGWAKRSGTVQWGPHAERRRTSVHYWKQPLRWARNAREADFAGMSESLKATGSKASFRVWSPRRRVFCASLADVFDNQVDPVWRADLFDLIVKTPELDWLLLTKRPENIEKMLPRSWFMVGPLPNVWLGTTCEDQERFDHRWPILREIPAAVRFISYEPAIGPLTLCTGTNLHGLHWLICGGESGHGYRYMDLSWASNIRGECKLHGISFFMKQLSGKKPFPPEFPVIRQFPEPRVSL